MIGVARLIVIGIFGAVALAPFLLASASIAGSLGFPGMTLIVFGLWMAWLRSDYKKARRGSNGNR